MNIVLLCREYPPEQTAGGIATYTAITARKLAELGHTVHVICQANGPGPSSVIQRGVRVHRTQPHVFSLLLKRPFSWLRLYRRFIWLGDWYGWSHAAYVRLCQIREAEQVDLVEAPDFRGEGFVCAVRQPVPVVVRVHSPAAIVFPNNEVSANRDFAIASAMEASAVRRASVVTVPSHSMKAWVTDKWGLPTEELHTIPNPIDEERFRPAAYRNESGQGQDTILYVGRLEANKGAEVLMGAFVQLMEHFPQSILKLVGPQNFFNGSGRQLADDRWFSQFDSRGFRSRVQFVGRVPREHLPKYYREASVCVFPTVKFDNFPYTCMEAMSCGCSVIATDSGGMTEMIGNGKTGLLVPPGDVDALVEALTYMLVNRDRARSMGRKARQVVEERFSQDVVVTRIAGLYSALISRRHIG